MNEPLLFFKKYLQYGSKIASVVPSSTYLARAVCSNIDWRECSTVVELGAGTGPITDEILRHARPECRIIAIERDHDFVEVLQKRFSSRANLEIVEGDCADLKEILESRGIWSVDHIISGLPTAVLPRGTRDRLFRAVQK